MRLFILLFFIFFSKTVNSQIEFSFFKEEIDNLKKDRKVEKYWRELYRTDQDNTSLKIPMDSITVLNRLKSAYLIQKYGFPDPKRFGNKAVFTLLGIHAHNRFSDISAMTFWQLLDGKKSNSWKTAYPNYAMTNMLFWYNGKEIVLDQEFALALRTLENKPTVELDMEQLCAISSSFLYMQRSNKTKVLGEWEMNFPSGKIPLQLLKNGDRYYLKKGVQYFLLKKDEENVYRFFTVLDQTSLFVFENGELVLRDMYDREMGVYPMKN